MLPNLLETAPLLITSCGMSASKDQIQYSDTNYVGRVLNPGLLPACLLSSHDFKKLLEKQNFGTLKVVSKN